MRANESKCLRRPDVLDNRAGEHIDRTRYSAYGEAAVQAMNAPYETIGRQVDEVYQSLGAQVVRGISYAGEDPTRISLPSEVPLTY